MKVKPYLLVALMMQTTMVFSDEVFIVGKLYQIPVDCGYDAAIVPASDGVFGHKGMFGTLEAQPEFNTFRWNYSGHFSGTLEAAVSAELTLNSTDMDRVRQFSSGNLNVDMEYHGTPGLSVYYNLGCVAGKFKTIEWQPGAQATPAAFSMTMSKAITVPPRPAGDGGSYGFYAQAKVVVPAVIGAAMSPERRARISVTCRDGGDTITAEHILHRPGGGTHFLTIGNGDFNFENCNNTQFDLNIEFEGANFQLEGLEALYYELF